MAGRESVLKKRRGSKLLCKVQGKGILNAIEEHIDPDFIDFDQYTALVSKVLALCSELDTYDKDDSPEKNKNVIYMQEFKKETDLIIHKFLNYSRNFKENAADNEIEVKNKQDILSDNVEWKGIQIENELCDVTLACDGKQVLDHKLTISCSSDEKIIINCENELKNENVQTHDFTIERDKEDDCQIDESSKLKNKNKNRDLLESEYLEKKRDDNFTFEEKVDDNRLDQKVFWLYCRECNYKDKNKIYLDCHKKLKHEEKLCDHEMGKECNDYIFNESADIYYDKYIEPEIVKLLSEHGIASEDHFFKNDFIEYECEDDDFNLLLMYEELSVSPFKESCSSSSIKQEIEDTSDLYENKWAKDDSQGKLNAKHNLNLGNSGELKNQLKIDPSMKLNVATNQEDKFICEQCEKHFKNGKTLKSHIEAVHELVEISKGRNFVPSDKQETYEKNCAKNDLQGKGYGKHTINWTTCETLKEPLNAKPIMKLHGATNHDAKFVCEHCEEHFKNEKSLKRHVETVLVEFENDEQCKSDKCVPEFKLTYYEENYKEFKNDFVKEIYAAFGMIFCKRSFKGIWVSLKNLIKRSLFFQPRVYNYDEFEYQKCSYQILIDEEIMPNYYWSDYEINCRKKVCDTFVTNRHLNTRIFLYPSVTDDD